MNANAIPKLPCMCASLRRTSRALTQRYEDALRPFGLRATQFTVLQVLELAGEVSQGRLGEMLAMDSTTLTRTLAIMVRNGWIADRRGSDRRERLLNLAKSGRTLLHRALPAWEREQQRLRKTLGPERWTALMNLINEVTLAVTD